MRPRLPLLQPADRVVLVLLLPLHGCYSSPDLGLVEGQRQERLVAVFGVQARLFGQLGSEVGVNPHAVEGHGLQDGIDPAAGDRAQAAEGKTGGVAPDRVPLDHGTRHARLPRK